MLGGAEFVNLVRCLILEIKECFGIPQQQMSKNFNQLNKHSKVTKKNSSSNVTKMDGFNTPYLLALFRI